MAEKPKRRKRTMPAVPRDAGMATFSEMVPLRSTKIKIFKSPLFLVSAVGGIAAALLFANIDPVLQAAVGGSLSETTIKCFAATAITTILLPVLAVVYLYARPGKPFWYYLIPVLAVAIITATPAFAYLAIPFRTLIPSMNWAFSPNLFTSFIGMFFAAGLTEEYIKCIPAFLFALLAFRVVDGKAPADPRSVWPLRGPLDGTILGIAGGMGFIIAETAFEYVPATIAGMSQSSGSGSVGLGAGLLLLIPRTVSSLTGHMGYSAMVGYAIGLAVIRPAMRWKLILYGLLAASVLHATWNSFAQAIPGGKHALGLLMAGVATACVLKARQLAIVASPDQRETMGSIVVPKAAREPRAAAASGAPRHLPSPAAGPIQAKASNTGFAAPVLAPAPERPVMLKIDGIAMPLRAGETIALADEPALAQRGGHVRAAVVAHPTKPNVVGLRNAGEGTWTARLRDGSSQVIAHGQNLRLAPGVRIDFGSGLCGDVEAVG